MQFSRSSSLVNRQKTIFQDFNRKLRTFCMHEGTNSKQKQSQLFSYFQIHKEKN